MFIYLIVIGCLFLLTIIYLNHVGFLNSIEIRNERLAKSLILYCEYIGDYRKVGPLYEKMGQEIKPLFKEDDRLFGIYYDDPKTSEQRKNSRALCGLLIDEDEREKAQQFVAENPRFKIKDLPEIDCVYTVFPFKSKLSMLFIVLKIYPKIKDHAYRNRFVKKTEDIKGIMEIYSTDNDVQIIEVILPYGEKVEELCLSTYPSFQEIQANNKKED